MCQTAREMTPVEMLEKDLKDVLTRPLKEESKLDIVKEIIEKAKCYEHDFYNRQWEFKRALVQSLERNVRVLETQNRVLTEYIMHKEGVEV